VTATIKYGIPRIERILSNNRNLTMIMEKDKQVTECDHLRKLNFIKWGFIALVLTICFAASAWATASQNFYYESGNLKIVIHGNYSFTDCEKNLFRDANAILPHMLGLSRALNRKGEKIEIYIGCQQFNEVSIDKSGKAYKKITCDKAEPGEVIRKIADALSVKARPVYQFRGFTLQLAYVEKGKNARNELGRWAVRMEQKTYNEAIYISGDVIQKAIRIFKYNDNSSAIRFGIFDSYKNAKKAAAMLKLTEKNAQIIPFRFKTSNIDKYFH
jgi:hypothetical protein